MQKKSGVPLIIRSTDPFAAYILRTVFSATLKGHNRSIAYHQRVGAGRAGIGTVRQVSRVGGSTV